MKLNKSLLLTALFAGSLLTGTSALQAQDSTNSATPPASDAPKPVRARPGFDMIAKRLNLTDDQKPKVKPIIEDMMTKLHEAGSDHSLSREDRQAKMKEIRDATGEKLKEILTPEQYETWTKMGPGQRGPRPAGSNPAHAPAGTNSNQ